MEHRRILKLKTYTEIDEQMLHLNFHLLTEFVETQSAWMNIICVEENWSALPWWTRMRLALGGTFRSRAQGLEYLRWEGDQVDECGAATTQAKNAQTTLSLYHWWTIVRPYREDPWAWVESDDILETLTWEERRASVIQQQVARHAWELDATQYQEDTDKLIELMTIRSSLWT